MFRVAPVVAAFLMLSCGVSQSEIGSADGLGSDESALKKNDPCAAVRCAAGTHCKAHGQRAECVPDSGPVLTCASVLCIVGTVCEESPSGPRCVAAPTECNTDAECRLEDNYCGGCNCLVLDDSERAPTCTEPVQCFAAPCAVSGTTAACVNGQCVAVASSL